MAARKITYFPGNGLTEIILGEDAEGNFITGARPSRSGEVQVFHPTRSDTVQFFIRGAKQIAFDWIVDYHHDSVEAAIEFMRLHEAQIGFPQGRALGYLQDIGADGVRYLHNCVVPVVECIEWHGRSTKWRYQAIGTEWTDSSNVP